MNNYFCRVPTVVVLAVGVALIAGRAPLHGAAAARSEKVKAAYTAISGIFAPIWIAADDRLFQKQGVDVDMVFISGSPVTVSSLIAGEIEFAAPGSEPVISAIMGGADLTIVAHVATTTPLSLYAVPSIGRVEDLKGKTVAITRFASSGGYMLKVGLAKARMETKDVRVIQAGGYPEILSALQAGLVQGAILSPPTTYRAEALGFKRLWSGLGVEYPSTALTVRKSYLRDSEETVVRFMQAIAEGIHTFRNDREKALRVMAKYTKVNDRTILEKTYADNKDVHSRSLMPTVSGTSAILETLAASNPKAASAKPESFLDFTPAKKLEARGFLKKLYGQ